MLQVPIRPLHVGQVELLARPNDDSERYLETRTLVTYEGFSLTKSTMLLVDLTNRPYFLSNLRVPAPQGYNSTNVLTLSEGVVGPIVPHFPLNLSTALDLPQVRSSYFIPINAN